MADYAKIELLLKVSENSDLSAPFIDANPRPGSSALVPSESKYQKIIAGTGGHTVDLDELGAPSYVVVENEGAIVVTAAYTNTADASNSIAIAAGRFAVIPDVKAATNLTLTAASSTATCKVWAIGA